MNTLRLTAGDTKPLACNYPGDITGFAFELKIAYPTPLTKSATIVDAPGGVFQFPFTDTDLEAGTFQAEILTTYPDTTEETSDVFAIEIRGRL